jgi:type VI secretion system protein ImpC
VRPPRVHITYDVEIGDAIEKRELPFVAGVLADFLGDGGTGEPLNDRAFLDIDRDNFDSVMGKICPELRLETPDRLTTGQKILSVRLRFTRMAAFEPAELVSQIAPLAQMVEFRRNLSALIGRMSTEDGFEEAQENAFGSGSRNVIEYLAAQTNKEAGALAKEALAAHAFTPHSADQGLSTTITQCIATVDLLISGQLNEIMHSPRFQQLEATWRGLSYLVNLTETSSNLAIRILHATKTDILRDFVRANEIEQTALFQKVFTEEYGSIGGRPFGLLVGDYEFGPGSEDVSILEQFSRIGALVHAPFISGASPAMFGFASFDELSSPRDLALIFEGAQFTRWNSFRRRDEARYIGLCIPHILLRLPYGDHSPVEQFDFDEIWDGRKLENYLWGNTAFALAARITDSFARYGWCAAIRGVEGGGLVEGLPTLEFETDSGYTERRSPTDLAITDRREVELSRLGFIPLCHHKGTDMAVFFGVPSVHQPRQYLNDQANASAGLAGQLHYLLAVSRFAQFMAVMMRDRIGSFVSRDDCERFLNLWISNYVLLDDSASQQIKAQFPLREARIQVSEVSDVPGAYIATAYFRPHFQLEELSISLRLVVRLSGPGV